ncbi:MAG TPA: hypothetical protein DEB10_07335 [Ruminococcaceae bacterium]|jgi:hypothetical protein|nr:hypothetical protein [Oscillospiraceae bacterium]HCA29174.1 hypothetical protein [Oscillospiraceae bacterium]
MNGEVFDDNFVEHLSRFIGETVTIFTTSGGQSGSGFTGVILSVNRCFVRLITRIGPAPGCALGNACNDNRNHRSSCCGDGGYDNRSYDNGYDNRSFGGRFNYNNVGSVTDIPIDRIASFVHNAV